jgi:hypothetical protein
MDWIVEAHAEQGLGKLLFERGIEVGASREHAVIKGR